jgi:hypothetical protein
MGDQVPINRLSRHSHTSCSDWGRRRRRRRRRRRSVALADAHGEGSCERHGDANLVGITLQARSNVLNVMLCPHERRSLNRCEEAVSGRMKDLVVDIVRVVRWLAADYSNRDRREGAMNVRPAVVRSERPGRFTRERMPKDGLKACDRVEQTKMRNVTLQTPYQLSRTCWNHRRWIQFSCVSTFFTVSTRRSPAPKKRRVRAK